jgi:hypothetical protein
MWTWAMLLALAIFDPPKRVPVTDDLKSDLATVASVKAAAGTLVGTTQAGPVTYHVSAKTFILGTEGANLTLEQLKTGERVRVYYVTGKGAEALEIDVLP